LTDNIRVRFAPSPTGFLHLGGLRTALYNFLFAQKNNGRFLLRIEDTDRTRYVEGAVENMVKSLQELGIDYDEGPFKEDNLHPSTASVNSYFQSERLDIYHKYVEELISNDKAYHCFCTKEELDEMRIKQQENKETTKYDGRCRILTQEQVEKNLEGELGFVVRMKMPNDHVFSFDDLVRGNVQIASDLIEDQVILKADGFPTYHLAAVVDDHLMGISHVLRGEEWLYSTPKHIFLYESLGWTPPIWVHLPLLLNTDRSKLSKRLGDFSVSNYISQGYLKEAIINFVALLGWHSAEDRELFTLEELIKEFTLERITKSGAIFDITKLDWMNGHYIRNLPLEYIGELCKPYFSEVGIDVSDDVKYLKVIARARDQITKLPEIILHSEMFYKESDIKPENMSILSQDISQSVIKWFINALEAPQDTGLNKESITTMVSACSQELGIKGKTLFFPLRIALFRDCNGPDISMLIDTLGIKTSIERLKKAL